MPIFLCREKGTTNVEQQTRIESFKLNAMAKKSNNRKSPYDPEFVAKIKRSEQEIAEGKYVRVTDVKEFIANLSENNKDDEIVATVTERFMQNCKGVGELNDKD